jgi:hypothetical protein
MSFGQGMALSYSWKHKINTKSSTEAELVGVDDSLGYILWSRYFMVEQGYDMEPSLLYQDNMSAILLETNGRASSTKQTKHIKVKYYLIKDKVDQGEITIEHCPTKQMWTDINTKPKQGAVFRAFRGHVMGIPLITTTQVLRPCVILDHRSGYLNQCRCYPYQGIGSQRRSVLENEQLPRKLRFWIRVQQRTDEFSLL